MNQNLGQLRREVITSTLMTDQLAEQLERRVIALEEITAARWPRRILVRRRLARDLRASVAGYREAGPDFEPRRVQAVSDGWIEPLSAHGGAAANPAEGRVNAPLRSVPQTAPATPATAVTRVREDGSAMVSRGALGVIIRALGGAAQCQDHHLGQPHAAAGYRRLARRLGGPANLAGGQDLPALGDAGETGPAAAARAAVEALDSNDRIWLLTWIAGTCPELAAAGVAAVAERHEAARRSRNRRSTLQARRKRAERRAGG